MSLDGWNKALTKAEMDAMRAATGPFDAEAGGRAERNERKVREGFWKKFARIAGHVPFAEDVLAAFFCATDPATSFQARAILFAALVYFLWPGSLIPRVAVAVGLFDEAAVLLVAVRTLGGAIKPEHRERARAILRGGIPDV